MIRAIRDWRGWQRIALLAALTFAAVWSAQSASPDAAVMMDPPSTELSQPVDTADGRDTALADRVARHVADDYRIEDARYFKLDRSIGWNQVQMHVASIRSATRRPPKPLFRDDDGTLVHDLIDVYPPSGDQPAFAVAMSSEPFADGSRLIGYFILAAR